MEERERTSVKSDTEQTTATCSSATPAPEQEPETGGKPEDDDADKVDVCSDKFDPLLALYSPAVSLPFPNIKCFNNVSDYESFLRGGRGRAKPENVEKKRLKAMKGVADPERIERLKKLMVNNKPEEGESSGTQPRRRRQKPQKNVLTRMPLCKGSPLGELYRCVEERIRVKVHIRTFKGLRGVCSGFVVAFDKFWNMAMVDVDETYREPLLGEAFYHEKALTISRLFDKLKIQERSAGDDLAKKPKQDQETATKHQPAHSTSKGGHSRTESKLSDAVKTREDKHKVSLKDQSPEVCQKKDSKMYGKVRVRHINQLFIRGENVILVNPQPL
ncbi:U7 snRNA-associated Sm-like protein LSm11 isoform X2 [Larimichthys crocea]|uniref:U7 snRNA-associated Sm-like protein LSm11 isoform X1 n=1 Tax=Larimichthys crocea TaxID=215358 RepID=UPI0009016F65|nr:U7 snRNA-associated Sm-like protein LSm11 isoform X1 [Larimichthys crocea]XP_027137687.1 U7 snRNA-associated Sm-like protein LSm11 isoform X2 [Larimichthys crocea]